MRRIYHSLICFVIGVSPFFGQDLDSLKTLLSKSRLNDTVRIKTLISIISSVSMDEFENYLEPLRIHSEKLIHSNIPQTAAVAKKGKAVYFDNKAFIFREKGEFDNALSCIDSAIELISSIKRSDLLIHMYHAKGLLFTDKSQFLPALDAYQQGLTSAEKNKDTNSIMLFMGSFAVNYKYLEQYKEALSYAFKGLRLAQKMKDHESVIDNLNTISTIYSTIGNYDSSYYFSLEGYKLAKKYNDEFMIPTLLNGLGYDLQQLGRHDEALTYYQEGIKYSEKLGTKRQLPTLHNNISRVYYKLGKLQLAKKEGELAYSLCGKDASPSVLRNITFNLNQIYRDLKDFPKAFKMLELYVTFKDSTTNTEMRNAATKKQMNYIFEKKQLADSLKVDEDKKISALQLKQEKNQRYVLYIGLSLVIVFALFIFNRFRVTQKQKKIIEIQKEEVEKQKLVVEDQKHLIEEKHKEITDSINYAERIQRSFLATKEILDANLPEYFVLFKPKDVVSGDFYWANTIGKDLFAVATADSTGHGVPGAIMSLLNITSIEGAIKDGYSNPAEILDQTRKTIIERLKKDGSIDGGKDGMDCILCVFNIAKMKLEVAAANNPVWIARKQDGNEASYQMIEIKPDKMPVGKHDNQNIPFNQHAIELKKGDIIYTLTDGFPDQFGGPLGKKFMSKNLRELILANAHLPMAKQKELLEDRFKSWLGELEQIDDVTIVGVKV